MKCARTYGAAVPNGKRFPDDEGSAPTIYDAARAAGVSIASVSRVLNGRRNPRPETRDRVLRAVSEPGFAPDGAARALSARLKETVGVAVRRLRVPGPVDAPGGHGGPADAGGPGEPDDDGAFADEAESLQFPDMINRGIERAAQRRDFDLLARTVGVDDHDPGRRIVALARKSDGLILRDRSSAPVTARYSAPSTELRRRGRRLGVASRRARGTRRQVLA